jgi:hypothetical protein
VIHKQAIIRGSLHCNSECVVEILAGLSVSAVLVIGRGYALFMLVTG